MIATVSRSGGTVRRVQQKRASEATGEDAQWCP